MQTKSLSILEWHELVQKGAEIPMRMLINGVSMHPLIRRNRDMVTIVPLCRMPVPGEIVMFAQPEKERYVLHRAWQVRDGYVLTWGDNCNAPDGWMPQDKIWGLATRIERGRFIITPKPKRGLRWARIWHPIGRLLRRIRGLLHGLYRRFKRLFT